MLVQTWSTTVVGVRAVPVRVEVNAVRGLPGLSVVGLPQGAVREGRDRVRAAVRNGGWTLPPRRVTIGLSPADLKKEGSGFDLAMAVGLLAAAGSLPAEGLETSAFLAELGLDGALRPVRGVLPAALACERHGLARLWVSPANLAEARAAVRSLEVLAPAALPELVEALGGSNTNGPGSSRILSPSAPFSGLGDNASVPPAPPAPDLAEVRGQPLGCRALEVAAAGGHNLLLSGPPGTGKTLLARCLPGLLPPLEAEASVAVSAIHSVAGLLEAGGGLLEDPPFRAPHHTASPAALVGGGTPLRPGEVSLAHEGVLFLDELPEFGRPSLEGLRQPLEDGRVILSRARQTEVFPARFILVAAMNPCPCGRAGVQGVRPDAPGCTCDPAQVSRYRSRVSGPLRDRMDLHVGVQPVPARVALTRNGTRESSAEIRERVARVRAVQRQRASRLGIPGSLNARLGAAELEAVLRLTPRLRDTVAGAADGLALSTRGLHRVLRVSRTLADLEEAESVGERHLMEALQYRTGA